MVHTVLAGQRVVALAALVLLSTPFARADGLQPGLWRVLSRPVIDGVAGREQQSTRCPTQADRAGLEKTLRPPGRTIQSTRGIGAAGLTPPRPQSHLPFSRPPPMH